MTAPKRQAATQEHDADYAHALAQLRGILPEGSTVYTILRHVSRSGMSRRISFKGITVEQDGLTLSPVPSIYHLDGYIATVMEMPLPRYDKPQGLRVDGYGMDMGYHVVYNLSRVLYPNAEEVGYSLNHRWL